MKIFSFILLIFILLILFGAFMIVYGGYDDSPGAQALGLILLVIGIVGLIKNRKKFV